MKQLKRAIEDYFGFSGKEANGFLVLSFVCFVSVTATWAYKNRPIEPYDSTQDKRMLDSLIAVMQAQATRAPDGNKDTLFYFDPNRIGAADWQLLGCPPWLAKRITKFKDAGGTFRSPEDVQKIYDFPEELYRKLEPYIQIEKTEAQTGDYAKNYPRRANAAAKTTPELFDINTADTTQLIALRGIGSTLAKRIVAYRDKLGGFYDLSQLSEVYGLKPEVIQELTEHCQLSAAHRKIAINSVTEAELKLHPYVGYKLAKPIIAYREQHGRFMSGEDLKPIKLLSEENRVKLLPYLNFD